MGFDAFNETAGPGTRPGDLPFRRDGAWLWLAVRLEAFFVRHRDRIAIVHMAMFAIFLALLLVPLSLDRPPEPAGVFDHFTAFANFAIWGAWLPLVLLSVIATGRSWCGLLCPMGAASEWANARGLKRPIPRWMKWPGTPIISFVLVTVWAQTAGARDHAPATAIVFGGVLAAALAVGALYGRNKRAWCRHMCPIGLLLGVYARLGAIDFHPKRPRPGGDMWTERSACPTMIDLDRKTETRHCIECFRCVSPQARGGLYLRLRRPGAEVASIRDHNPSLSEVLFVFIGTGAALGGFLWLVLESYQTLRIALGNWVIDRGWLWLGEAGPIWLMAAYPEAREVLRWFDVLLISGYMLAWVAMATLALGGLTAACAWLSGRTGGTGDFGTRFVELGYQFLPVAMVSLLLGLGADLFQGLELIGLGADGANAVKGALFLAGGAWSLYLGYRLLARQGVADRLRWLPLLPGGAGTLIVGAAWYPAVFGG